MPNPNEIEQLRKEQEKLRQGQILRDEIHDEEKKALNYITERMEAFQANVSQAIAAMQLASREYDRILKLQAVKPLSGEIFVNLLITIIPVAKPLQFISNSLTLGKKVSNVVEAIDGKIDDFANSFRGPISARNDSESTKPQEQQAFESSNTTILNELGDLFDSQQKILDLASKMRRTIAEKVTGIRNHTISDRLILRPIETAFKEAGLDTIKKVGKDQLAQQADLMLYCLLRQYTQRYVDFGISKTMEGDWKAIETKRIDDLPDFRREDFITGLNSQQRKDIYKKFGDRFLPTSLAFTTQYSLEIQLLNFPLIKNYKDIIRYWLQGRITLRNHLFGREVGMPQYDDICIVLR